MGAACGVVKALRAQRFYDNPIPLPTIGERFKLGPHGATEYWLSPMGRSAHEQVTIYCPAILSISCLHGKSDFMVTTLSILSQRTTQAQWSAQWTRHGCGLGST